MFRAGENVAKESDQLMMDQVDDGREKHMALYEVSVQSVRLVFSLDITASLSALLVSSSVYLCVSVKVEEC